MKIKFCKKCGVETERRNSGTCKPCRAVAYARWQEKNPKKAAASRKAALAKCQKANPEEYAAAAAKWQKENPEKAAAAAKWHADRAEKIMLAIKANSQNNRAHRKAALGTHTAEDICAIATYQNKLCACCAISIKGGYHVDHIKALSRGGSNDRQNLQLLCQKCNLRKNARHPIEFMKQRHPKMIKAWAAALLNRREVLGF